MKKVKVLSVMLWVTLSLVAATYVGCKNNQEVKQEEVVSDSTAAQSDTTVIDTTK